MTSSASYYLLDLRKLRSLFRPGVPFSDWYQLCETAGPDGFAANSLCAKTGLELTLLQKFERIIGTLLYINISGAGFAWLGFASFAYSCGCRRIAAGIACYVAAPFVFWQVLCKVFRRCDRPRYDFPYQHQHMYLHMKYVWPAEMHPTTRESTGPFIFCVVPHGVLPFGIDYATVDQLGGCLCHWVAAPILFKLPFIASYLKKAGVMPAKAANIKATLENSENVGVVLDGVAGIFQPRSQFTELAWLLQRKGIAKIALQSGASLVPIYGFGHTSLLTPVLDPFGILKWISIKLDISFVPFFGRWLWPMGPPRREPVAMVVGKPVACPRMPNPQQKDIDECHEKLLGSFQTVFETHKAAFGWSNKRLVMA